MDVEKLKKFIKFMDENQLSEIEIEEDGKKIRLKKSADENARFIPIPSAPKQEVKKEEPKQQGLIEIKSPMVGTFYRTPAPGTKPYAEKGSVINQGDIVCIIEAMKLLNEIKSEITGEVIDILAENGEPVEFNQPLFLIKP